MKEDDGDMGFMESMVAMMAVIVVLTAYLAAVASSSTVLVDPTEGIEASYFTGVVEDGTFVPAYAEYVVTYAESNRLSGISVSVTVPGDFCNPPEPLTYGTFDGTTYTRTLSSLVDGGNGRWLIAVFEVTVCAERKDSLR